MIKEVYVICSKLEELELEGKLIYNIVIRVYCLFEIIEKELILLEVIVRYINIFNLELEEIY